MKGGERITPIVLALEEDDARELARTVNDALLKARGTEAFSRLEWLRARLIRGDERLPLRFSDAERIAEYLDPNVPDSEKSAQVALRMATNIREYVEDAEAKNEERDAEALRELNKLIAEAVKSG